MEQKLHGNRRVRRALIQAGCVSETLMSPDDGFDKPEQILVREMSSMAFEHVINGSRRKAISNIAHDEESRTSLLHFALHIGVQLRHILSETGKPSAPVSIQGQLQRLGDHAIKNAMQLQFPKTAVPLRESDFASLVGCVVPGGELPVELAQCRVDFRMVEIRVSDSICAGSWSTLRFKNTEHRMETFRDGEVGKIKFNDVVSYVRWQRR